MNHGRKRRLSPEEIDHMPHHRVITQKLRIVFHGSVEHSLTDALHMGPSILRNLLTICIRFRIYNFMFSVDIVKMYPEIWVAV